jgi:hypothetical protein
VSRNEPPFSHSFWIKGRRGRPFAKAVSRDAVVDDAAQVMDVTFTVDPGPIAGLGVVGLSGTERIDPAVVRSFIYTEAGDPYSPKALADVRRSVAKVDCRRYSERALGQRPLTASQAGLRSKG